MAINVNFYMFKMKKNGRQHQLLLKLIKSNKKILKPNFKYKNSILIKKIHNE